MRPAAIATRRRVGLLALLGALMLLLAAAPTALADAITPESGGSPNADDIDTLYKVVLYIAIVIFVLVEGVLIWSLVRFRARRGAPPAQQIRGNTPLEMGWTIAATLILVLLTAVTFLYLDDIKNPQTSLKEKLTADEAKFASINQPNPPDDGELKIRVNSQQYLWRYDYPGKQGELFSYYELVVPAGKTVTLKVTSQDVVHSWWVPKLGGKVDAVPDYDNETWFRISKPGTYTGVCAELCGEGHADMRTRVVAKSPQEYEAWVKRQKADIKQAQTGLAEMRKLGIGD